MRKVLEDLYHGNLTVSGQTFRRGTKYACALAKVAETEDTLSQNISRFDAVRLAAFCCQLFSSLDTL